MLNGGRNESFPIHPFPAVPLPCHSPATYAQPSPPSNQPFLVTRPLLDTPRPALSVHSRPRLAPPCAWSQAKPTQPPTLQRQSPDTNTQRPRPPDQPVPSHPPSLGHPSPCHVTPQSPTPRARQPCPPPGNPTQPSTPPWHSPAWGLRHHCPATQPDQHFPSHAPLPPMGGHPPVRDTHVQGRCPDTNTQPSTHPAMSIQRTHSHRLLLAQHPLASTRPATSAKS